jgi:hypothetical protein
MTFPLQLYFDFAIPHLHNPTYRVPIPNRTQIETDIPNSLRIAVVVVGLSSSALFLKQIRYRMNAVRTASVTSN